jgi:hypothetical protein
VRYCLHLRITKGFSRHLDGFLMIFHTKSRKDHMEQISLLSTLRELECELHQPKCRGNRERLAQLLACDFREFGRSGASYTRDDTLAMLPLETEAPQVHAQDFAVYELADSIVLLTYRSAHMGSSGELFRHTNRSSIWRFNSTVWQMVFHQGTPTDPFDQSAT